MNKAETKTEAEPITTKEFKCCPLCGQCWESQEQFLKDPKLLFNGYQASFEAMDEGLFYFTHTLPECCSTMIIEAPQFYSLYSGTRYPDVKRDLEECPRHCYDRSKLERCAVHCEYAFAREVSQRIHDQNLLSRKNEKTPPLPDPFD